MVMSVILGFIHFAFVRQRVCDNTPLACPLYLNHPNYSWSSNRLVVSLISGQGYFTFLYGNTTERVEEKKTNTDMG